MRERPRSSSCIPRLAILSLVSGGLWVSCLSSVEDGDREDEDPSVAREALLSGFVKSRVTTGVDNPTAMAFLPDGRLLVTQRGTTGNGTGGTATAAVRVIRDGVLLATPFVNITVDNTQFGCCNERGLLGITVDPNFNSNHFVYVFYTAHSPVPHNRVSRFTANGDVAVPGSEVVMMEFENLQQPNHNGGGLHFGTDGKLYVAHGNNAVNANSQSIANRMGKILRINADGTIPADNPTAIAGIAGSPTGVNRAIWAAGLRNPFSFGINPATGQIFVNDVGQASREEVDNLLRGANYGWSLQEGFLGADNANFTRPIIDYAHGDQGACAITGGTFYHPANNTFGAAYLDKYFFADFCGGWVRMLDPATRNVTTFDTGLRQPVDLQVGPDGALYILLRGTGEVWKIQRTQGATQGIVLSTTSMNIDEGASGTFTVTLAAQPAANVVVNVARSSGDASLSVSPASLTFTPANWNVPQVVTVAAAVDGSTVNVSALIRCSSTGLPSQYVVVMVVDSTATGPIAQISLPHQGDVVFGTGVDYFGSNIGSVVSDRADFYISGALRYTDMEDAPPEHYHYLGSHSSWDTTQFPEGQTTLMMKLFEKNGTRTNSHRLTVTVDNLPSPWNHRDLGGVGAKGSARASSGIYTVKGAGADIGGTADEFQYVYRSITGDHSITARLTSQTNTNADAKAGVMFRETLTAGSTHAMMALTPQNGAIFERRTSSGGGSTVTNGGPAGVPLWLRVTRVGNTLSGYRSVDGAAWTFVGSATITMAETVYVGLAVSSHNDATLGTAIFDSVSVQ